MSIELTARVANRLTPRATRSVAAALALGASPILALAQPCQTGFQPGEPGASGIFDTFSAYVQPITQFQSRLYFAGSFSAAGSVTTNTIASFDPMTESWAALGGGVSLGNTNGFGAALSTFFVGGRTKLIYGGFFTGVNNTGSGAVPQTASLAAWDGTEWSSLNTGWTATNRGSVWALRDWEQSPGQRRLVVGGGFTSIGSATADGIAIFDGSTWSNIAGPADTGIAGPFSPVVFCTEVYNGQLYIGGRFATVNGVTANLIARWSGSAWQRPGIIAGGGSTADISSLCVYNDGTGPKLYAGGFDIRVGGVATTVAAYNGTTWTRVGQNLGGRGTALAVFDDGTGPKLYLGMTADGMENYLYRLESNTWVVVDGGLDVPITPNFPSVFGLYATQDSLYVGGNFQIAGGEAAFGIARYAPCEVECRADFNNDTFVNSQDFFDFLSALFALEPRADFNSDGFINSQDFFDFINALFAGC